MPEPASPLDLTPGDEALVIRCQLGDRRAFADLLARWLQPAHRYLWDNCGSQEGADELAQDVWLRVLRGLPALRDAARFRSWLFGIAHRVLVDGRRTPPSERTESDEDAEPRPGDVDDCDPAAARQLDAQALAHGLATLSGAEREVVTLFYLEGLSLAEVASVLAIPPGTVKSRLLRARQSLRCVLADPQEKCHE